VGSKTVTQRNFRFSLQICYSSADNSIAGDPLLNLALHPAGLQWDSFMATHIETALPNFITLDCDHALNHAGGDPELLMHLCRTFLDELPFRIEQLRCAIAGHNHHLAGRALLQLQSCILVFGAGHASLTAKILENAIRDRRSRLVRREWKRLEAQLQHLVPQVQRLMLEMANPTTPVQ
jgi:HPt (histidine-containing phosphotransfer) domain-containing protein